jgi:hypothetical protein
MARRQYYMVVYRHKQSLLRRLRALRGRQTREYSNGRAATIAALLALVLYMEQWLEAIGR